MRHAMEASSESTCSVQEWVTSLRRLPPQLMLPVHARVSQADTMERLDPVQLNRVAASLAVWAYAIAALPDLLPRNASAPPAPAAGSGSGTSWVRVAGIAGGVAGGLLVLAAVVVVVRRRRSRFYRSPAPAYSTMASDYFRE